MMAGKQETSPSRYQLRLLGPVQILQDGQPVRGLRSRKAVALLAYVAAQESPVTRITLVDLFWPDQPEARGRANLSWVLHYLTKNFPGCLTVGRHTVQCQPHPQTFWLDVVAFVDLLGQDEVVSLTEAVSLYRDEFMAGFVLNGCPEFEFWLLRQRERWQQLMAQALSALVAYHTGKNQPLSGLDFAARLLELNPWREEAHRQIMMLLARSGQRSAALAQYKACRRILAEELGVEPTAETRSLYEQIRDRGLS